MDATCEIEVFGSFQYILAIDLEYCDLFLHKYLNETIITLTQKQLDHQMTFCT